LLFHCDEEWNTLGCSGHPSVTEAKQRAEQIYGGISSRWVDARISEEAAEAYLSEMFGNERCSFCGRRPDQVNYVFGKDSEEADDVRICDRCVNQFHGMLPK
jgi:hypothetical protein